MGLTGRKPSVWLGSDPFLEALGKGLRPAFPASGGSLDCVVCGPLSSLLKASNGRWSPSHITPLGHPLDLAFSAPGKGLVITESGDLSIVRSAD